MRETKPVIDRFNEKWVKAENGCHVWVAGKRQKYGCFYYKKRYEGAHRVIWDYTYGQIPEGMFVCHKCDNPSCVNIDHLFLGTQFDNMRDMANKKRHPYPVAEKHHRAKLTNQQVIEIRSQSVSSNLLAKKYGVTKRTILNVRHGYTYGSVA